MVLVLHSCFKFPMSLLGFTALWCWCWCRCSSSTLWPRKSWAACPCSCTFLGAMALATPLRLSCLASQLLALMSGEATLFPPAGYNVHQHELQNSC